MGREQEAVWHGNSSRQTVHQRGREASAHATFAHPCAVQAAYLALTQFFDQKHELVLLLVNTLLSDLKSDNFINVCTALVVCTKLIGVDLVNAVIPVVVEKLRHPKEHVRKKAIMVLLRQVPACMHA